jgi:hypothetical protein
MPTERVFAATKLTAERRAEPERWIGWVWVSGCADRVGRL